MIHKEDISNIEMMTDEERVNPALLYNRKEVKENPIAVYYGSYKPELKHACDTCKKYKNCQYGKDIILQGNLLREAANDPTMRETALKGLPEDAIEKAKTNVFVVVNCIYKEE